VHPSQQLVLDVVVSDVHVSCAGPPPEDLILIQQLLQHPCQLLLTRLLLLLLMLAWMLLLVRCRPCHVTPCRRHAATPLPADAMLHTLLRIWLAVAYLHALSTPRTTSGVILLLLHSLHLVPLCCLLLQLLAWLQAVSTRCSASLLLPPPPLLLLQ
jgi:hypothetical protein